MAFIFCGHVGYGADPGDFMEVTDDIFVGHLDTDARLRFIVANEGAFALQNAR